MTVPLSLIVPDWPAPANVRAAMTTRVGGVSRGPYASLNLGRGGDDDPAAVDENRRRVRAALGVPAEPRWIRQVHGARVVRVPDAGVEPQADASWTGQAGVVCVVQAADCLPVLLCDDAGTVVAAAHAGWRGLSAGVLEATVKALPVKPESLMAWMGAAIGPESFEVGGEVREAFVSRDAQAAACFVSAPFFKGGRAEGAGGFPGRREARADFGGKFLADLYALARQRLAAAGITRVYGGGHCTYRDSIRFFSFRRDGRCGRMAALVWLNR